MNFRLLAPILALIALVMLFFMLPQTPDLFICKACASRTPYLPLIGSGYFTLLFMASVLFPVSLRRHMALGGLVFAVLLAGSMSYVNYPLLCRACLIAHICHILFWVVWVFAPAKGKLDKNFLKERLCLTFFAAFSVVSLFASIDLTLMAYSYKARSSSADPAVDMGVQIGQILPVFEAKTIAGTTVCTNDIKDGVILNFTSADCPYCNEQQPILLNVMNQLSSPHRLINISPSIMKDLQSSQEWIEDKDGALRELFKVKGYPTLIVIGSESKISKVIVGVPDQFQDILLASLQPK